MPQAMTWIRRNIGTVIAFFSLSLAVTVAVVGGARALGQQEERIRSLDQRQEAHERKPMSPEIASGLAQCSGQLDLLKQHQDRQSMRTDELIRLTAQIDARSKATLDQLMELRADLRSAKSAKSVNPRANGRALVNHTRD
jgi:uncharacterized membrane protein YhiD involved in acid resistance